MGQDRKRFVQQLEELVVQKRTLVFLQREEDLGGDEPNAQLWPAAPVGKPGAGRISFSVGDGENLRVTGTVDTVKEALAEVERRVPTGWHWQRPDGTW
jgi:hypothetical protein